jgi:hypothetical protein
MSSKINVKDIVLGHIATLSDPSGKRSVADYFTFFFVPGLVCILGLLAGYNLNKDVSSMLVNFGAIFTALLLSVLVLVHDQESKLSLAAKVDPLLQPKKILLGQLYYNICFSILSSIVLVALCFIHSVIIRLSFEFMVDGRVMHFSVAAFVVTPAIIFVTANLLLTIIMIVKRMHAMLTI